MPALTRRDFTRLGLGAGALASLGGVPLLAADTGIATRPIPSSGEEIPIIGLGTNRYGVGDDSEARAPLIQSLGRFHELGATVIDTAPSYRSSEAVLGELIAELGIRDELFIATKIDREDSGETVGQMQASLDKLGIERFDLIQVHNLKNWKENVPLLRQWKDDGKARYIGVTGYRDEQLDELERVMRAEALDFIQIHLSLESRKPAERILPLAADQGVAVMLNRTFGAGRMFSRLRELEMPAWAADFDVTSWAQFLLKYALSHPAATVAIPGMTKVRHVEDNVLAGHGRMPDAGERQKMEAFYDAL